MKAVRVRVENGQITGRAPEGFPEGEVDMCLAVPDDGMGPEELERLNASLDEGWRCIEEGRLRPAADLLADLRRR
jgi:hypothetical protein